MTPTSSASTGSSLGPKWHSEDRRLEAGGFGAGTTSDSRRGVAGVEHPDQTTNGSRSLERLPFCNLCQRVVRREAKALAGSSGVFAVRPDRRRRHAAGRPLLGAHQSLAAGAALCAKAGSTLGFARLLVEFPDPDFFLDAATLDQLSKPPDGFLSRLLITQSQFDHAVKPFVLVKWMHVNRR